MSKHKDITERLVKINPVLAREVREILDENKAERHIRGRNGNKIKISKKRIKQLLHFLVKDITI